ncbi:MAG: 30S ribosomal protein S3 [Thaumarchaeota archaeon]|nr:30S ribosomal protein S3 [Nitrososphaerota archaeon]
MSAVRSVLKNNIRNAEIDEFLEVEVGKAGYAGADIQKTPLGARITLFVTRPGLVIGRRGVGIRDLTERLGQNFDLTNPQLSVMEVEVPELDPRIMAQKIVATVSRGTAFRRAAVWTLNSIMAAGALGAEIAVAGKLRSERSRFEKHRAGILPKSGDAAEKTVRTATVMVQLKMGLYGIKVKIAIRDALPSELEILYEKKENAEDQKSEINAIAEDQKSEINAIAEDQGS